MLAEFLVQVAPNDAQNQGNQGCDEGHEGDACQTGSAHGNHGEERTVVQGQQGDGAGVIGGAVLLCQSQILAAGGVGDGRDDGHGG